MVQVKLLERVIFLQIKAVNFNRDAQAIIAATQEPYFITMRQFFRSYLRLLLINVICASLQYLH